MTSGRLALNLHPRIRVATLWVRPAEPHLIQNCWARIADSFTADETTKNRPRRHRQRPHGCAVELVINLSPGACAKAKASRSPFRPDPHPEPTGSTLPAPTMMIFRLGVPPSGRRSATDRQCPPTEVEPREWPPMASKTTAAGSALLLWPDTTGTSLLAPDLNLLDGCPRPAAANRITAANSQVGEFAKGGCRQRHSPPPSTRC